MLIIVLFFLILSTNSFAKTFESYEVVSGDMVFVVGEDENIYEFEFNCMRSPYFDQLYFEESKDRLKEILSTGDPIYEITTKRNLTLSGKIYSNGKDICVKMIQDGMAWANIEKRNKLDLMFNKSNNSLYYKIEKQAKANRVGLWSKDRPTPPWESKLFKEKEKHAHDVLAEALAKYNSALTPYEKCMESELGRGYKLPKVTFGIVGALVNLASIKCGGKGLYKAGVSGRKSPSTSTSSNTLKATSNIGSSSSRSSSTINSGCISDLSCGIGKRCIKKPYSSSGICVDAVNEFGRKTYKTPSSDISFGKKECSFSTDCPIGFRCDSKYKKCVK